MVSRTAQFLPHHKENNMNAEPHMSAGMKVASARLAASPAADGLVMVKYRIVKELTTDSTKQRNAMSR